MLVASLHSSQTENAKTLVSIVWKNLASSALFCSLCNLSFFLLSVRNDCAGERKKRREKKH